MPPVKLISSPNGWGLHGRRSRSLLYGFFCETIEEDTYCINSTSISSGYSCIGAVYYDGGRYARWPDMNEFNRI